MFVGKEGVCRDVLCAGQAVEVGPKAPQTCNPPVRTKPPAARNRGNGQSQSLKKEKARGGAYSAAESY